TSRTGAAALPVAVPSCCSPPSSLTEQFCQRHGEVATFSTESARSETTYLNILGGLLNMMLGKSPGGMPYSSFETMESVISALLAHYEGRPGISERTLWAKFTAAKRHLDGHAR
ncbi:hypothetical protein PZU20_22685, partial [Pseudomonas aeruginosa]|nr:hypothetical protein [Pseudomonas aeruginosa]